MSDATFGEKRQSMANSIARHYSAMIQHPSSGVLANQIQIMNIYCGLSAACGDCAQRTAMDGCAPCAVGVSLAQQNTKCLQCIQDKGGVYRHCDHCQDCTNCINRYVDTTGLNPGSGDSDAIIKTQLIDRITTGVCSPSCECKTDVSMDMTVTFAANGQITTTNDQKKVLVQSVQSDMMTKFDTFNPTSDDIETIAFNPEVQANLQQKISQMLLTVQVFTFQGAGEVKNVRLQMVVDAVMNAIAETSSAVDTLNHSVLESMTYIRSFVDRSVKTDIKTIWDQNKKFVEISGAVILTIVVLLVLVLIAKAVS